MYKIIHHDDTIVEIVLFDCICKDEFLGLMERLRGLSDRMSVLNILFDTTHLNDSFTVKVFLDEYRFLMECRPKLNRMAFISDDEHEIFMLDQLNGCAHAELKTFDCKMTNDARKWLSDKKRKPEKNGSAAFLGTDKKWDKLNSFASSQHQHV